MAQGKGPAGPGAPQGPRGGPSGPRGGPTRAQGRAHQGPGPDARAKRALDSSVCIYTYISLYIYTYISLHIYMYLCTCISLHIYMYIYICIHTYIHIYMCVYMYLHVYIYTHIFYTCCFARYDTTQYDTIRGRGAAPAGARNRRLEEEIVPAPM